MKKLVSTLAVVALLFTMSANAQEKVSKKKQKAKTEKAAVTAGEKKECSATEKKGAACCAHKAEAKS
jgi:Ni/Co efflux regulator RcnB